MPDATAEPGPEPQGPESQGPESQGPEAQGPEAQGPEAQPDADLPQAENGPGDSRFTWVPGSQMDGQELSGPVPPEALPGGQPTAAVPGLDWQALLEALAASGMLDGDPDNQDAELAEELEAERDGRMGPSMGPAQLAALAVEYMEPGPALAGWLNVAAGGAASLNECSLTGLAIAARKQAAHVHGVELTAVAQITSRAAAADRRIGVSAEGRPARVCRDAVSQVEMALRLSHDGAEAWADLALTLSWRLPRTGAALAVGWIDLDRAQIIARATSVLSEETARAVEAQVLPEARRKTYAELRARLHHLVIAADPEGAEERRQKAERGANVRLYADDDQTATLVADKLPQIESASGLARINALARARKAAGLPGTLGLHRAQVLLGLILGTPPPTEPTGDAPPGAPHPSAAGPGPDGRPSPGDRPGPDRRPSPDDRRPRHRGRSPDGETGPGEFPVPPDELPPPPDEPLPADDLDATAHDLDAAGEDADQAGAFDPWEADDDPYGTGPVPTWPALGYLPPGLARPAPADGTPPAAGLLDVTLPWVTMARLAARPGTLGRIGAITPAQARQLAMAAADDPTAQWRVIVVNPDGHAIAVARIRRLRRAIARGSPPGYGPLAGPGTAGRVTLTITQDTITALRKGGAGLTAASGPPAGAGPPGTGPPGSAGPPATGRSGNTGSADRIIAAALRTADRALQRALVQAEADAAAGGCAHTSASDAYRPPPRLREYVIARDLTCGNPVCRQPAWRADLDHTIPWEEGGPTCSCNLGGECRRDHQLKQHPRWKLAQVKPGWFEWTAPSGRTYTSEPATYTA
jgi:Domain of unknown function (DUF222)